mgnify:CR=1 FL=1
MKFKLGAYYMINNEHTTNPTFGLYKCTDVKDDGVVFETFYAAGVLGKNFLFIKFEQDDFWSHHLYNLHHMKKVEDYNIFKNIIETLFGGWL